MKPADPSPDDITAGGGWKLLPRVLKQLYLHHAVKEGPGS